MEKADHQTRNELFFDIQGHRGARGLLPENTIPAFLKALELGVTTLEMDVVISADNKVVVSHEQWFNGHICTQPSGLPVPVEEERSFNLFKMPYTEIARFDCGSRGNPRFPQQEKMRVSKPLLSAVIEAAEAYTETHGLPPTRYNIETKSSPVLENTFHPEPAVFTRLLYDVVKSHGILERTTIQSFDPRTLQVAHEIDSTLSLALLVGNGNTSFEDHLETLGFVPAIYSPNYNLVNKPLIDSAREKGMQVIPWTVNTLPEMEALKELGVDGIITDYPNLGVTLL